MKIMLDEINNSFCFMIMKFDIFYDARISFLYYVKEVDLEYCNSF